MSFITIYNDIAGRITRETYASSSITVAGVGIETSAISEIENHLPSSFPKWRDCQSEHLSAIVEILMKDTSSMAAISVNKNNQFWTDFWNAADLFQKQFDKQAGFAKAANVVKYWLFGYSITLATVQAIKRRAIPEIYDNNHYKIFERTLICDTDIQGDDNIQTLKDILEWSNSHQPLVASLGLRITTRSISFATEQEQRLLLLADYLSGITHCYLNKLSFGVSGISTAEVAKAFDAISNSPRFIFTPLEFDLRYSEVFAGLAVEASSDNAL